GVLGPHDDRCRRTVTDTRAVEHAEASGHPRCAADGLGADLLAELGARVAGAGAVVLGRDVGQHAAQLTFADAVLLGVGGHDHAVHGGRCQRAVGAVGGHLSGADRALVAAVLHLLDADGHG